MEDHRTIHAQAALEFTDVFKYKFGDRQIGKKHRRLRLREPDGPSTAGGKHARQSLVLETNDTDHHNAIVCGWIDVPQKSSEIRAFDVIDEQFKLRFHTDADVLRDEYEPLFREVQEFLHLQRFEVALVKQAPQRVSSNEPTPASKSSTSLILVLLLIAGAVGLALGYLFFK